MHEHTLNNAGNTTELAAGLNGFFKFGIYGQQFAQRDLRRLNSRSSCENEDKIRNHKLVSHG